jgi:hypothetical protein
MGVNITPMLILGLAKIICNPKSSNKKPDMGHKHELIGSVIDL